MKEGWTYKKLGEVCEIYNGNSINADFKKKHFFGATGGLPFIATKDVSTNGSIDYDNGVRIPNYDEYKVAPANSVFVCAEGGSAGKKFAFVEQDVCFGNKLFCLNPKHNSLMGKYIYYFVQSDVFKDQFYALLSGLIGGVSAKKFQQIEIPVSSIDEQRSIISRLDAAFAHIDSLKANAEKQLVEARQLFQTELAECMKPKEGWEEKKIKDIANVKGGKRVPKGYKLESTDTGHKYIRVSDFRDDGTIDLSNILFISDEVYRQIKNYTITSNDVYISIAGTIGKSGIIPESLDGSNLTENACKLVFTKLVDKRFIYLCTKSDDFKRQIDKATKQASQPKLALTRLAEVVVYLPCIEKQQKIVSRLDTLSANIKKLEEVQWKTLAECDALKQAMLREVFE